MLKRRFDKLLSAGKGRQLLWLAALICASFFILLVISRCAFTDDILEWQDVMALYLDPGCFSGPGKHDYFRLIVVAFGVFLFSALLISVFTNIFDNISEAARKGERRYRLRGHTIFLGNSDRLAEMIRRFLCDNPKETAVIMTTSDVEKLREAICSEIENRKDIDRVVFYHGERDNEASLRSACIEYTKAIYILGEKNEAGHDSTNLRCCDLVKAIVNKTDKEDQMVPCFLTIEDEETVNVLLYDTATHAPDDRVSVEVIDVNEYEAEQLLVSTDFLPVIRKEENVLSHIVITGTSPMACAFARVAAHLSHYPNFRTFGNRTRITFIGQHMRRFMDNMAAIHPWLFTMSHRRYVAPDGTTTAYIPDIIYGDFLDIEWEFVDTYISSGLSRNLIRGWAEDSRQRLSIAVCDHDQHDRIRNILYLSEEWRDENICVWIKGNHEIISKAMQSGMYGNIKCFGGDLLPTADPLFIRRSRQGMRVNYIYAKAYNTNPGTPIEEWTKLSFAHKYSSILCANAISLRGRCYDESSTESDRYEAEHRRWSLSVLLMGYKPYPEEMNDKARAEGTFKKLKSQFIHLDLMPYDKLPESEKAKDKLLIDNSEYIISGDESTIRIE